VPGWVLVDNLRRPRRATRSAVRRWAGLRPMTPSGIAKLTGTETRPNNRKGIANHHPLRWTQNLLPRPATCQTSVPRH
jgi:hypothetical protein